MLSIERLNCLFEELSNTDFKISNEMKQTIGDIIKRYEQECKTINGVTILPNNPCNDGIVIDVRNKKQISSLSIGENGIMCVVAKKTKSKTGKRLVYRDSDFFYNEEKIRYWFENIQKLG